MIPQTAAGAVRSATSRETAQTPGVVAAFLEHNADVVRDMTARLRRNAPDLIVTNARGSSDHAAVYGKYLIMQYMGVPVISAAPSLASIYGKALNLRRAECWSISQSGQSPDLISYARMARKSGARTVAITNEACSPLAQVSDLVIPQCAGTETAIAATKSFIASQAALLWIVAEWKQDKALLDAILALPDLLQAADSCDWSEAFIETLNTVNGLYTIGRGTGFGVALEAALKFKEICRIHGEAFSAAECHHGPAALLGPRFPALIFAQSDPSLAGTLDMARKCLSSGAPVLLAGAQLDGAAHLDMPNAHPSVQPILQIYCCYQALTALARTMGRDPDTPPGLRKVTETR